jgi:2-keto-3-deoxy-L-rhamnonate aldolase RhmA
MAEPEELRFGGGQPALGIFVAEASPALAEALAASFDFLAIDLEHGALDLGEVQRVLAAAQDRAAIWVRVPTVASERIAPVIDAGADGIIAPSVESAVEAAELVSRLTYPPHGQRGLGIRRAGDYGRAKQFWTTPQARVGAVVQIETVPGVERAAEIAGVNGLGGILVGCSDLSMSLGRPGDIGAAELAEAVREVEGKAQEGGVAFGLAGGGAAPAQLLELASGDVDFFLYSLDIRVYAEAADTVANEARRAQSPSGDA